MLIYKYSLFDELSYLKGVIVEKLLKYLIIGYFSIVGAVCVWATALIADRTVNSELSILAGIICALIIFAFACGCFLAAYYFRKSTQ
jgi:hypothetical protein